MKKFTLEDIIGYEDEKYEIRLLLESLKHKDKNYAPRGLLLEGEPGMGKTFFAEVFMSECGLKTFTIDGTQVATDIKSTCEDINKVFNDAKNVKKGAIIFIDEVHRLVPDVSFSGRFTSDQSRAILSCLLTNLDGINDRKDIFIIMTCNNRNVMDEALYRPGRVDKIIALNYPTSADALELLKYYASKYQSLKDKEIDYRALVRKLQYVSCAAIRTLVAETAISVEHNLSPNTSIEDIFLNRIMYIRGYKLNTTANMPEKVLNLVAYHELGHAIVTYHYTHNWSDVAIDKSGGGGVTYHNDDDLYTDEDDDADDEKLNTLNTFREDVQVSIAGRVAESLFIHSVTSGSIADLGNITRMFCGAFDSGLYGYKYISGWTTDISKWLRKRKFISEVKRAEKSAKKVLLQYEDFIKYIEPIFKDKLFMSAETLKKYYTEFTSKENK